MRNILALVVATMFLTTCGGALDQPKGETGGEIAVELVFPDGYAYDGATGRIALSGGGHALTAPSYVTGVTLTVSDPAGGIVRHTIPLDTLSLSLVLTPALYRFDVLVTTRQGDLFTASREVRLTASGSGPLVMTLEVNAPPVIDRIDVTPATPKRGDLVTVTAYATDPDADDTLAYRWDGRSLENGAAITRYGQSVSERALGCGRQEVTLTVSDGKGGSATRSVSVGAANNPPVATGVTVTNLTGPAGNPKHYDDLRTVCHVTDPDGDTLDISYRLADGTADGGSDSQWNYNVRGGGEISCWAVDSCGDRSNTATATLAGGSSNRPGPLADFATNYVAAPFKVSLIVPAHRDVDLKLVNEVTGVSVWYGNFRGSDGTDMNNDYGCESVVREDRVFVPATALQTGAGNTYRLEISSPNSSNCPAGGTLSANLTLTYGSYAITEVAGSVLGVCSVSPCAPTVNVAAGGSVTTRFYLQ